VDDEIVVYSGFEDSFSASTYIATVLRYLGAKRVGVLDGGFEKWELEQRPVTKAFPKLGAVAFRVTVDKDLLIDATQLQGAMKADEAVVLDARSAEQFAAGHIPGALNLSMRSLIGADKGMPWRDSGEIRATAAAAGLKPGKPVVTYCNSGREASQLAFTLQHVLGFDNVKVYDGSMVDWTARDLPRETTPKP
jgi:thiosulfate/3-mercaptopyruvate sulfurtransferase